MKKIFYLVIFCLIILVSGCKDTTPRIFLSTKPIMKETFVPMEEFKVNDTINFVLIAPKGFKSETVRLQLIKKNKLFVLLHISFLCVKIKSKLILYGVLL